MSATLQKLKEQGWHLTDDGLQKISADGSITDTRDLLKIALDTDLRLINKGGSSSLPSDYLKSSKIDFATPIVMQVQSCRNVSAPKSNEESKTAPRLLRIELTDGSQLCTALEMESIQSLSVNTAPGTKVQLKGSIRINQNMLWLTPANVSVIGGLVAAMHDSWEVSRTLAKYARGIRPNHGPGGPPPWIPFGQKSQQQQVLASTSKGFKSLADKAKEESNQNVEFTTSRTEAIAAAYIGRTKKQFGGGKRQMVDFNVRKITDKGYTVDQAEFALKCARNNLEKAMGSLKKRDDKNVPEIIPDTIRGGGGGGGFKEERFERRGKGKMDLPEAAKPSAKLSLFDFLEDKIKIPKEPSPPISATTTSRPTSKPYNNNQTAEHNHRRQMDNKKTEPSENPFRKQAKHHDDAPNYGAANDRSAKNNTKSTTMASTSAAAAAPANKNNPFSLENRAKFENNISSSFANSRGGGQRRDDEYGSRGGGVASGSNKSSRQPAMPPTEPKFNNRNDRNDSGRNNNRNGTNIDRSKSESKVVSNNNKSSHSTPTSLPPPPPLTNSTASNYNASANYAKNANKFIKGVSAIEPKSASNRYHCDDNKNKSASGIVAQLTKATSALKISGPQQNSNPAPAAAAVAASARTNAANTFEKAFPHIPSGYEYNPNKIMGFQNKETNEFAMNVLKSSQKLASASAVSTVRADTFMPTMQPVYSARPPPQSAPTIPTQHQHRPIVVPHFNWATGDFCFAKYWEDGRYYQADITGISEKTCVVHFMDYGNYEEVLLTDCLPINDGNIQMVNLFNSNLAAQGSGGGGGTGGSHYPSHQQSSMGTVAAAPPSAGQPMTIHRQQQQQSHQMQHTQPQQKQIDLHHSQQQQQQHHHQNHQHHQQQQQQHRFRGERQVYVPPAQRSTK